MIFVRNLESLTLDWDKIICELLCVFTGFEILWERFFEKEEDSPFSDLETSWEAIPEGGRPKMLGSSEAGGFKVAWIALRSSGVWEMDSTLLTLWVNQSWFWS